MIERLKEQVGWMRAIAPEIAEVMALVLQTEREALMKRGFTREEAMQILVSQAGSGELMKVSA